jgi:hypothetical protein
MQKEALSHGEEKTLQKQKKKNLNLNPKPKLFLQGLQGAIQFFHIIIYIYDWNFWTIQFHQKICCIFCNHFLILLHSN